VKSEPEPGKLEQWTHAAEYGVVLRMGSPKLAHQAAARAAALNERLVAAYALTHETVGITSRPDERGLGLMCQYPTSEFGSPVTPELRAMAEPLAREYYAATELPPERCMVVWGVVGDTIRVSYEVRPEGWT
jgi:hypothetical protein